VVGPATTRPPTKQPICDRGLKRAKDDAAASATLGTALGRVAAAARRSPCRRGRSRANEGHEGRFCAVELGPMVGQALEEARIAGRRIGTDDHMAANGNARLALLKCSCSIDVIAGILPYARYELAETTLNLQAGGALGGRVGLFRDPPELRQAIEALERAQAEANLQCFG
jgi:hypothetical protein